jgi:hypothetical protein
MRIARPLIFLTTLAALPLTVALPAHAASPLDSIVCTGSETDDFTPPLTNTPRATTVDVRDDYSCTSLTSAVSSASGSFSVTDVEGCLLTVIPSEPPFSVVYTFKIGTASSPSTVTFTSDTVVNAANGTKIVTSLGTVTSGWNLGAPVTRVVIVPSLSLTACAGPGVASYTGVSTLTVTPL